MRELPAAGEITLGLLAGGRGGQRDGAPGVPEHEDDLARALRFSRRFPGETGPVLIRVHGDARRYAEAGMQAVASHAGADAGPFADVAALAAACVTPWLLTLPVDVFDVNDCLVRTLVRCAAGNGAVAEDDEGVQPRVALYRSQALRALLSASSAGAGRSLSALQERLGLAPVRLAGVRFGQACRAGGPPRPLVALPRRARDA
ncbi:NTP transferase domain-containing protein [Pseudoxanthomonas broegbernensis]|uniref:NTP transferase domain-containing protein n=1 Tax=Pseudoxanthomonas broegbernensis TaxID=83619 RepID=UPI001606FEEC|nr:NTP transferase domain-containing protein [Pseudoxanthomonas broegbernensis]MBB6064916.1 molybdopterin-guanine dinucleotide biosynthesis protein A [Pseudoxanthomonas broegbernensis]